MLSSLVCNALSIWLGSLTFFKTIRASYSSLLARTQATAKLTPAVHSYLIYLLIIYVAIKNISYIFISNHSQKYAKIKHFKKNGGFWLPVRSLRVAQI